MRAWSIGVITETPHGTFLTSVFTLAKTRGEAAAQGIRHAIDEAACGPDCDVKVRGTQITAVSSELILAAADELRQVA